MRNIYGYQHEKLGAAVRALMIPVNDVGQAVAGAMHEFTIAFHNREIHPDAQEYVDRINLLMETDGEWAHRAAALTELELHDLVRSFWELDRTLGRLYYSA